MAPDRGLLQGPSYQSIAVSDNTSPTDLNDGSTSGEPQRRSSEAGELVTGYASEGQSFSVRGILVGLGVGLVICFSNMYFGLQTGWVSSMSMPASLIGFAYFKTLAKHLDLPFTPVENVLVQTVAGSMGTMPLGCGFVGVMPALNYLLQPEEQGPLFLSLWKLILWALGLCFFGVVFAVPLRRQVILREKLKFPSGTATALMIGVLHGKEATTTGPVPRRLSTSTVVDGSQPLEYAGNDAADTESLNHSHKSSWKSKVKLLVIAFAVSGLFTVATYFLPIIRDLPVFGSYLAQSWLWTLNPSLAYVGQGIIMGPATTTHMLLGAIVGWGILSPLAKAKGWAPGPVDNWETGSTGWIIWVSLAIMLADSVINLGYIAFRPLFIYFGKYKDEASHNIKRGGWKGFLRAIAGKSTVGYTPITQGEEVSAPAEGSNSTLWRDPQTSHPSVAEAKDAPEPDAPPEQLVNNRTVWIGLILSVIFCVASIRVVFGPAVPLFATIMAVVMALLLSVMGVRALGETDLNPVSGISKLAQLFFALIIPQTNKNSVLINLVAGAVSESGALQAGDLIQDLKTGHLLGAAPNAQFWGQIIGSAVGAVVSALIYQLYTSVYDVPGKLFKVPTAYVWIFTARLVTGDGLPKMAWEWALGAAVIFSVTTAVKATGVARSWNSFIPGGVAVAVGMYNVPSFTLPRAVGGFLSWYWLSYRKRGETSIVILASGLILGEGVGSIVNLLMTTAKVPHYT